VTDLPEGTLDLHVHVAPDGASRRGNALDLARAGAGGPRLSGAVLKGHLAPTGALAALVRAEVPRFAAFGSVVLNRAVGGLNPAAVAALARVGGPAGRVVWLPTRDACNELARKGRRGEPVAVVEGGVPVPALHEVAAAAHDCGMILASGHIAPAETAVVFRALARADLTLLATHVTAPVTFFEDADLRAVLDAGAIAELCARNLLERRADLAWPDAGKVERAADLVRRFGASRFVLSSDLGAPDYPDPAQGLAAVAEALNLAGLADGDLEDMLARTPRRMVGLDSAENEG